MFIFKKKTLNLDFFTSRPSAHDLFPPDYSNKFIPEWWKKLPQTFEKPGAFFPTGTIKSCYGFRSYYKQGFMIPLWSDFAIDVAQAGDINTRWKFSDDSIASSHPPDQWDAYLSPLYYTHIKLHSPWFVTCKDPVDFIVQQPLWNQTEIGNYTLLPGVVDFKYQQSTQINMMVKHLDNRRRFIIPSGTPIIQFVPLTDRKIKIHTHLVSVEEEEKIWKRPIKISFVNKYAKVKKIVSEREEKSKCPFSFFK